ncbi:MAG: hypothetical protein AB7G11_03465 [Phycisphaerales bacterium]
MGIGLETVLKSVRDQAVASGAFGGVKLANGVLACIAKFASPQAEYRLYIAEGKFWIALVTADRWLSESIESDLVDNGDDIEDLLDDEARARGYTGQRLAVAHFRDGQKMYTFRSPIPIAVTPDGDIVSSPANIEITFTVLMTYQEVFSELGDMSSNAAEN